MNSFALKRPSSARRNIKQETFSSFVSSTRLRSIQNLLHKGNGDSDERCNAVLCILGIDSRYNDGCRQLVDYLLFNFFDSRKNEIERSGYEEEIIDDMMFLIRRDRVDVYCNPVNYLFLLPYVAHWRNLRLHCMTDTDYEDNEAAEEFKINSFLSMVAGCNKIGIPYTGTAAETSGFDKMLIEKWPIIQAFALEEIGGGGFFTMKYEVSDMSPDLHALYHHLDPVSLETVITEQLPLFERQWGAMMTSLETGGPEQLASLTERGLSESLWSYFNHGRVGSASSKRGSGIRHPFTLFGCHSNRSTMEKAQAGVAVEDTTVEAAGVDGAMATHMVCQAVSPRGPLSCTRTYFFGMGVTPHPVTKEAVQQEVDVSDIRCLSQIYGTCVKAVHNAIQSYVNSLSITKMKVEAYRTILKEIEQWEDAKAAAHVKDKANLEISIEAHDNNNSLVELHEGHQAHQVKTVTVTVYDVPLAAHSNHGSISFGESFIDSALHVQRPDGIMELDTEFCILTRHVPSFVHWPYKAEDLEAVTALKEDRENGALGRVLVPGEPAAVLTEANSESLHNGTLYLYEHGVAFTHPHLGALVLPKSHLEGIHFYDGNTSTHVALLILSYGADYAHFLPHHQRASSRRLVVACAPRSKAYKLLYNTVLPLWKQEEADPVLEQVSELPDELTTLQDRIQREHEAGNLPSAAGLRAARVRFPRLASLCAHFAASRALGNHIVPSKDVNALTQQPCDVGGFDDDEQLVLTVITGMVGSHKDTLCNVVTKTCKDDSRWAVIRHPVDHTEPFSPAALQAHLAALLAKRRAKGGGGGRRAMRAVVVTPGLTDTVDLVQSITNHPNRDAASHLKIGAVTVCLDHKNMFMKDRYTLPKLLDQCAQGWVNNIVFTGPNNDKRLAQVQELIRAVNADVALLLAQGGHVTRSPDLQLILAENAFSDPELTRARYLSCPGWRQGAFVPGPAIPNFTEVLLRFSRPLDKAKLFSRLRGLKGEHKPFPFSGNVYHVRGRVVFKGSEELQEVRYTVLSGHHMVSSVEKPPALADGRPACCVVFTGCGLSEHGFRDWLRSCAPQKPEKKVRQTRKSLSRAEIKKVHEQRHLEPLPEGWFYNGSRYVSLGGDKSDMHPSIDEFIVEHLKKVNKEVDAYNARIDREEYPDLFS